VQVWVDDVEFEAVEGDRGGVKRGTTVGRGGGGGCGGADSASTITILSSNGNPIAASLDLGPTGLDLRLTIFYFSKINISSRLVTADTKNRLFFVS
jgi:hypothetical protein